MNQIKYLILFFLPVLLFSCEKDMMSEINAGKWNHERSVLGITFENQIGSAAITASIDSASGDISVLINTMDIPDLSNIKIKSLELSYHATSSLIEGANINFENATKTSKIDIKSELGETRAYTIHVKEFNEELIGVWEITNLTIYGGTGAEYGGSAVIEMPTKSYCWSSTFGPNVEYDNTLTFTLNGVSDDGNPYGTVVNDAGSDGKYADFIYMGPNPIIADKTMDLTNFYRQIPIGTSTWTRDYSKGMIYFTDINKKVTTCSFDKAQTIDLGNTKSMTIDNFAFDFTLSGTADWTNIYSDYDKIAENPQRFWISVRKK